MLWRMQRHAQQLHCKYYNIIIWPQEPSILPYEPLDTAEDRSMPSPQAIRIISSKRYSITVFENHFFALQALQLTVLQFLKTIFLRYKRYRLQYYSF